jgi:nucleotide-binding universal stress UspA family protein
MKKILVPTDFSKSAQVATEVARDIAKKAGSELIFLHVIEEATGGSFNVEGEFGKYGGDPESRLFTMQLIKKAKKQMENLLSNSMFDGIKVKSELKIGTPFHGMRTIITEKKVDLVVMGTAGQSKVQEMIIGTNTEKVVRQAKCPVLTVQKKPATTDFKNIVYATAMSKDEEIFARVVKRTQDMYNATVHLVRINTPANFQRDVVARKYMQDFAKRLMLKNYTINVYNDMTEEEGIVYFADSIDADLITMATHGRTGFAHVLAGSIAEDVVSHSKRPVLTFVVKK